MSSYIKKLLFLLFLPLHSYAETVSLDNLPEDFVEASVVIASPGTKLYTVLGHASLRMQCPKYQMDYVFSYEAEDAALKNEYKGSDDEDGLAKVELEKAVSGVYNLGGIPLKAIPSRGIYIIDGKKASK